MQAKSIGVPMTHKPEAPKNAELHRACQQFESLFVLQLWRAMQRTIPNQPKTLNYAEMFDLHFAEHLAQNGRFGLADQLYRQLESALPQEPVSAPNPSHPDEGGSR
ncbi:MAG: rod-binding protein [Fimbriimonadales bacterium]